MNALALDVKIFAYDLIAEAVGTLGRENAFAFEMYTQGVVNLANELISRLEI